MKLYVSASVKDQDVSGQAKGQHCPKVPSPIRLTRQIR
jgi:hypothetical protein